MALKNYDFDFNQAGYDLLQAAVDARLAALEKWTRFDAPSDQASTKLTYTGGTFQISGDDYHFTQAAFVVPGYGVVQANALAAAPTDTLNAAILAKMIADGSPYLVAGAAA